MEIYVYDLLGIDPNPFYDFLASESPGDTKVRDSKIDKEIKHL